MKALSPGKLILSGEHSVVFGKPAIAIAVDRFAETTITPQFSKFISFSLLNLRYNDSFTVQTLREFKHQIIDKYQLFLKGDCGIRDVLHAPFELAQFTFINFLDHLNSKIIDGLNIQTHSNIPVGCGMGSSAAVILSVLRAIALYFKIDLHREKYLSMAFEAEKLQHGFPSGLDLHASLYGGGIYFCDGKSENCTIPELPMFMVNTGTPKVYTGECVTHVANKFKQDSIWEDFENVTKALLESLQNDSLKDIQQIIRENHQLLVAIEVVPARVQQFISDVEKTGAAAKICGAGSIVGEQGGIVLVIAESEDMIRPICKKFGYEISSVNIDKQGLHVS